MFHSNLPGVSVWNLYYMLISRKIIWLKRERELSMLCCTFAPLHHYSRFFPTKTMSQVVIIDVLISALTSAASQATRRDDVYSWIDIWRNIVCISSLGNQWTSYSVFLIKRFFRADLNIQFTASTSAYYHSRSCEISLCSGGHFERRHSVHRYNTESLQSKEIWKEICRSFRVHYGCRLPSTVGFRTSAGTVMTQSKSHMGPHLKDWMQRRFSH